MSVTMTPQMPNRLLIVDDEVQIREIFATLRKRRDIRLLKPNAALHSPLHSTYRLPRSFFWT